MARGATCADDANGVLLDLGMHDVHYLVVMVRDRGRAAALTVVLNWLSGVFFLRTRTPIATALTGRE
jgi:hypothetical protein